MSGLSHIFRSLTAIFLVFIMMPPAHSASKGDRIAFIVSGSEHWNGLDTKLTQRQITRIFRKQITLDKHGHRLHPVNLYATHLLRKKLSQALFRKTPLGMSNYWNERYFQGTSPPHVVNSQEAMIRFVASTPGAIGYVAPCMVDDRVKVIFTIRIKGKISTDLCH